MPHATEATYKLIQVTPIKDTVGAEVSGVDFSKPVSDDVFSEIFQAITKYGILAFRATELDDARHVEFARRFGELDDASPYTKAGRPNRLNNDFIFDVSNVGVDGKPAPVDSKAVHFGKGNGLFHVDSSFNPRRAGCSLLRAAELPPPECGGNTDFADTRTAFDDLPADLKKQLEDNAYIACHSVMHSRKKAAPGSPFLTDVNPEEYPYGRHQLIQRHEASKRMNVYVANHIHHLEYPESSEHPAVVKPGPNGGGEFERVPEAESTRIINELLEHATRDKYVISVAWQSVGDLMIWDNTCVMHRAGAGTFAGKYIRDVRRCTAHDMSSTAWGYNDKSAERVAAWK